MLNPSNPVINIADYYWKPLSEEDKKSSNEILTSKDKVQGVICEVFSGELVHLEDLLQNQGYYLIGPIESDYLEITNDKKYVYLEHDYKSITKIHFSMEWGDMYLHIGTSKEQIQEDSAIYSQLEKIIQSSLYHHYLW